MDTRDPPTLLGREDELAAIDRLISRIRAGRGGALVLRGEAGVGKTALLDAFANRAEGIRVMRTSGVEAEGELAFAAAHRMCSSLTEGSIDELPDPQRAAVRAAFGLSGGQAPDPFLVGLGLLNRLASAAGERPLVALIDDAQWLDRDSALTQAFVARRLDAEPLAIVFAVREPTDFLKGLPEQVVPGLTPADSRALLESRLPAPLDESVRERFIAEAHGNPLALLELPLGFTTAEIAGGLGIEDSDPARLSSLLDRGFRRRVEELPGDTRLLLRLAAAEPTGNPGLLWEAAALLGIEPTAAAPAEAAGLLGISQQVVFRHPAVRSAIYRSAAPEERREVHRALAAATDPETDPDRRAWHRANGTLGRDEEVAAELERSADRAQARGGMSASAAFLSKAVALTPDRQRRALRALAAAHLKLMVGSPAEAMSLLSTAERESLDEIDRARLDLARIQGAATADRGAGNAALLLDVAKRLESLDPDLSGQTYIEALGAALFADEPRDGVVAVARAARAVTRHPTHRRGRLRELLLEGATELLDEGYAVGAPALKDAVAAYREAVAGYCANDDLSRDGSDARWLSLGVYSAITLWDHEAWDELSANQVRAIRKVGDLSMLTIALTSRAVLHIYLGDPTVASALIGEIEVAAAATGARLPRYADIALAGRSGQEQDATKLLAAGIDAARARGEGLGIAFLHGETAFLCNGQGRYGDALAAAQAASAHAAGQSGLWLAELVEAATRSQEPGPAADAMRKLSDATRADGGEWAMGVGARSRALLADGENAAALYGEAIERLRRTPARTDLARAHLLQGEWLRREGRRSLAREELRKSHGMFEAIRLPAFARRAARELAATGERIRRRTPDVRDDLTERESQIARLAAAGFSNRRIGEQLYISHRTVGYHLGKVFTKLDVDNRAQLHGVLGDTVAPAASAGSVDD